MGDGAAGFLTEALFEAGRELPGGNRLPERAYPMPRAGRVTA